MKLAGKDQVFLVHVFRGEKKRETRFFGRRAVRKERRGSVVDDRHRETEGSYLGGGGMVALLLLLRTRKAGFFGRGEGLPRRISSARHTRIRRRIGQGKLKKGRMGRRDGTTEY